MKILFTTLNSKFIHTNLAIKYLSKCWKNFDVTTKEYTINEDVEQIFFDILSKGYDMVAFSCYIWNIEQTLVLAQNLKKVRPEMKILFGGPEASFEVQELMTKNPCIDIVVAGEGEEAMLKMSEIAWENLDELLEIPNLYLRKGDEILHRSIEKSLDRAMVTQDLSIVPLAYEDATSESIENKIVYYETSRGCTYNCSYCLSATSKGIRYFDKERVFGELKKLVELGAQQIKFVDRTFNADPKRAAELVDFLMQIDDGKINFHFEITAHLLQQELLDKIKNARVGLFQFEIGVQSTNPKTLKAVHRADQFGLLSENVRQVQSYGNIHQHLDLIAGLPYEGKERFIQSFNDVFELQPDALQMGFLKMLKGSPIYYQAEEFGYVFRSYPPYEILYNEFISATELMELKQVEEILDRYYNKGRYKNSMRYLYSFFAKNGYELFERVLAVIEENEIDLCKKNEEFLALAKLSEKLGAQQKAIEIKDDNSQQRTTGQESSKAFADYNHVLLLELLRLDYLMMGRNPNLPDFLKAKNVASKEEIFELLKEEGTIAELGFDESISPKEAFKKIQWSNFDYDVLQYKDGNMVAQSNVVVINYDYLRRGDERFAAIRRMYEIKH